MEHDFLCCSKKDSQTAAVGLNHDITQEQQLDLLQQFAGSLKRAYAFQYELENKYKSAAIQQLHANSTTSGSKQQQQPLFYTYHPYFTHNNRDIFGLKIIDNSDIILQYSQESNKNLQCLVLSGDDRGSVELNGFFVQENSNGALLRHNLFTIVDDAHEDRVWAMVSLPNFINLYVGL